METDEELIKDITNTIMALNDKLSVAASNGIIVEINMTTIQRTESPAPQVALRLASAAKQLYKPSIIVPR